MVSTPPTVREHFEAPETVEASVNGGGTGLWDVERSALAASGTDGAGVADVLDGARGVQGAVLVDIGCGAGRSSLALATTFDEIVLMDLSPTMLDAAAAAVTGARGGTDGITTRLLDVPEALSARRVPAPGEALWRGDLRRADLVLAANVLCYVRGREQRIEMLRAIQAHLARSARLLVTNHVVPAEGVQELRDMARSAGRDPAALGEDALLDTSSGDGSFVHWFTPESLAEELGAATDGTVDLKVSEDGLRAAALLSSAASAGVGETG